MSRLSIRPLKIPAPDAFGDWTYPFYRSLLEGGAGNGAETLACGLFDGDDPAGLCLTQVRPATGSAQVISLLVAEPIRGSGWGARLLAETEAGLRARGARELGVVYTASDSTAAFEGVLRRCGWEEPRLRMILCKSDAAHILEAPWICGARLAQGFETFPWRELSTDDRGMINELEGTPLWHPRILSPFNDEQYYDPETSLGLRYRGELAGWVVTHRVIPGSLRYTNVFVRADVRWKAPHLPMVAEVIRRQIASSYYHDTPFGMFNQPVDDPAVHRFFVRRLKPYLISVRESKGALKRLL